MNPEMALQVARRERGGQFSEAVTVLADEVERMRADQSCWFCNQPAVTFGWGFALCGGRPDGEINCSERARVLVERTITERAARGARYFRAEVERLRAMEAAIREDCWSDRDPHGTFERYLNAKATT